jgi:hypothetical protein
MPCPRSANVSCRTRLRPLAGLILAVCGLALVMAGMPGFAASGIPPRGREAAALTMDRGPGAASPALRPGRAGTAPAASRPAPTRRAQGDASQRVHWIGEGAMRRATPAFGGRDLQLVLAELANVRRSSPPPVR